MGKINRINTLIGQKGIWGAIKYSIQKSFGIIKQQEEIDTLYYFLNKFNNISELPPTDNPDLRIMQKCDAIALAIFGKLCEKHGLRYWLDYGTLLGAVRHKGFIPWDDDTDISMPREDLEKVIPLMKNELEQLGFEVDERSNKPLRSLGIAYKHSQTGIWIDVFPSDTYMSSSDFNEAKTSFVEVVGNYRKVYWGKLGKLSETELKQIKKKEMQNLLPGNQVYIIHLMESNGRIHVNRPEEVLPLNKMNFEGFNLNVPADPHAYLADIYGSNYMAFPRGGVNPHGGAGTGRDFLYNWAKSNGIDMNNIYNTLVEIYNKL